MNAVTPVILCDHMGVERELRFTPGARKRIAQRFGTENIIEIANKNGDWALYEIAWLLMFDRQGQPPAGLSLDEWMEGVSGTDAKEVAAAMLSAITQGRTPKNALEEILEQPQLIGSTNGLSPASVSDLQTPNIGGDTPTQS